MLPNFPPNLCMIREVPISYHIFVFHDFCCLRYAFNYHRCLPLIALILRSSYLIPRHSYGTFDLPIS